jgi:riboflavin kinase/FMN adenylyltransferase
LLCSLEEKSSLIRDAGIDYMVVIPFSTAFSEMSHEAFVQDILVNSLKTKHLIVGYDHRFGKDRLGDIGFLKLAGKEFGFGVSEIGRQEVEEIAVSSSRIRRALEQALPEKAAILLGRNYSLEGVVIKGDQRGRTIGFPTANLQISEPTKLIPGKGVYVTVCLIDGKSHPSMTNIGIRPTVGGSSLSIETHLLNFDGDLYGKEMELVFLSFLREELKFNGLEELKVQLAKDQTASMEIHQKFSEFHQPKRSSKTF